MMMVARLKAAISNMFLVALIIIWWRFLMGVTADYWPLQWFFTLALAPFVVVYAYRAFTLRVDPDTSPKHGPVDNVRPAGEGPRPRPSP